MSENERQERDFQDLTVDDILDVMQEIYMKHAPLPPASVARWRADAVANMTPERLAALREAGRQKIAESTTRDARLIVALRSGVGGILGAVLDAVIDTCPGCPNCRPKSAN